VWTSTQSPHESHVAGEVPGSTTRNEVITPDVGGGFGGPNTGFYPEEVVVPLRRPPDSGRPVKWVEDRREHLMTLDQERDKQWEIEMRSTARCDSGVPAHCLNDQGASTRRKGIKVSYKSATALAWSYKGAELFARVVASRSTRCRYAGSGVPAIRRVR